MYFLPISINNNTNTDIHLVNIKILSSIPKKNTYPNEGIEAVRVHPLPGAVLISAVPS